MTWTLWLELIGMGLRYLAPYLVGLVGHIVTAEDQQRLIEILTSQEMVLMLAASLGALALGVRSWLRKTRLALTAAAAPQSVTVQQAVALSKTSAPPLSTPAHEVPRLTPR